MGWGSRPESAGSAPCSSQKSGHPQALKSAEAESTQACLPASSADIGRAAERRNSPSLGEDASAGVLGRTADLLAPKARMPSEEARRPSGQGRRHAAPASVPATERCMASKQTQLEQPREDEGRKEETRVPSAQTPSAVVVRASEAGPPGARSPTPLKMLAGRGAAVAAEEAVQPSSREIAKDFCGDRDSRHRGRHGIGG
ncbi:hypothetical protein AXG93_1254s1000 [Marchantia polymorpha subsp. ruderalis]|uniref:Uncharacterized protein n=1 Tax=Marchantia polymorpha subsp. ruderalis TaxID=1480154 RepID=A0A176WBU6_MARPO|nr:hypothetical protein AXG93_1254s1000 [Marchantia polymorpha subsp. ruderalis]